MFQAPVSREVTAQDFVDSWNRVTDPKNQSYVSYILAPIEGCDDGGYQVDPKKGLTGVTAIDPYTLQVKLRYPFAEFARRWATPWPRRPRSSTSTRSAPRRTARSPSAPARTWSSRGRTTRPSSSSRTRTTGTRGRAGYVDNINMPIILESSTSWLEFQKGTIDYTDGAARPGRGRRGQPQGQVGRVVGQALAAASPWTSSA